VDTGIRRLEMKKHNTKVGKVAKVHPQLNGIRLAIDEQQKPQLEDAAARVAAVEAPIFCDQQGYYTLRDLL
jgi:hypothetical protein